MQEDGMTPQPHVAPTYDGPSSTVQLRALLWRMRAATEQFVAEAGPNRLTLPGAAGYWTIRDVIAHLTAWRWWSVARLEGAVRDAEPTPPWDSALSEENEADIDRINQGFYEATRDQSIDELLRDSRATFDRLEAALLALPEADLFAPGRYPWLGGYPAAAIVTGSAEHLFVDHLAGIVFALARGDGR
jgi:hypothetical protein